MISISSNELNALMALFFFPFVRIMAWLSVDPLLGNRSSPVSVRVAMAFVLALVIAPLLPPVPPVPLVSGEGLLMLIQQILIGVSIGFVLRIVFSAVEVAGQLMGLQMGLSFATLFDPINGAQTPVMAQFLVLTTALILFSINGHHMVIGALLESFQQVPISPEPMAAKGFMVVVEWAGAIFSTGLQIALPVTATLLATNLAIGMMTRAAPQLNIFAVGFPLTLAAGFFVPYLTLAYFPPIIERIWMAAIGAMGSTAQGLMP